jgi:hypothetical protein
MTFNARLTVAEVIKEQVDEGEQGRTDLVVRAAADALNISANTEGDVRSLELTVRLADEQTAIKEGDVISVSGHFDGQTTS